MKKVSLLTLVLSDRCNFSCPYCPQRKGKSSLRLKDIQAFLESLRPRLGAEVWLAFYGGEPLLSWPLIEKTVAALQKKKRPRFRFTLTTNGSLLKEEHIHFFRKNRFSLVFSYDGQAQKYRDADSIAAVEAALANLRRLYPDGYMINSVFTPRTVPLLAASIEEMLKQGHRRLQYSLDPSISWRQADLNALEEQLGRLAALCLQRWRTTGKAPPENFKKPKQKGIFACSAGRDRLALLPDRTVWGCELFHALLGHDPQDPDYANYGYGNLDSFTSRPAKALAAVGNHYAELRQDYFFTNKRELCSLCDDLEHCAVCPAVAALTTGTLAVLPAWTCHIMRITRTASSRFQAQRLEGRG